MVRCSWRDFRLLWDAGTPPCGRQANMPSLQAVGERFGACETGAAPLPCLPSSCYHSLRATHQDRDLGYHHGRGCGTASPSLTSSTRPAPCGAGRRGVAEEHGPIHRRRTTDPCIYCCNRRRDIPICNSRAQGTRKARGLRTDACCTLMHRVDLLTAARSLIASRKLVSEPSGVDYKTD